MPTILLDVDGVLADFTGRYLATVADLTGEQFAIDLVDQWHIHKCSFFIDLQTRHPDIKNRVEDEIERPGWCESITPLPHAHDLYRAATKYGDVVFVTSPWLSSPTWAHERHRWLEKQFGKGSKVVHTSVKELVDGNLLIDDNAGHCARWAAKRDTSAWLWDAHHNRTEPRERGVKRVGPENFERSLEHSFGIWF